MADQRFTIADLTRILLEGAGADEHVDPGADILDTTFADLGYDSLALLETGGRIEREFGITLPDAIDVDDAPRGLISTVNAALSGIHSA